jgi:hypothetical protein
VVLSWIALSCPSWRVVLVGIELMALALVCILDFYSTPSLDCSNPQFAFEMDFQAVTEKSQGNIRALTFLLK